MAEPYEFWVGDNCCIEGTVGKVDASFDHAFGKKKDWEMEIETFRILFYIDGTEFDITESIRKNNPLEYSGWRERLLRIALENN